MNPLSASTSTSSPSSSSSSSPSPSPSPTHTNSKNRIKVFARCRPAQPNELDGEDVVEAVHVIEKENKIVLIKNQFEDKDFVFDQVFGTGSTQEQVFKAVAEEVITDVFQGYYGTIFVYGQTGTGKTHTIGCRDPGNEGIIPRSIRLIFQKISNDQQFEYTVRLNYIQIYMEMIQDLLNPESTNLQIRQEPGYNPLPPPQEKKYPLRLTHAHF